VSIEPQSYTTNPNRQTLAEKYSKIILARNLHQDKTPPKPKRAARIELPGGFFI